MLSLSRCCCCILLLKFINWHPVKCACCCFAWTLNQWIFTYFFTEADSWKLPSTNGFMGFALILWRHDYDVIRRPADVRSWFELTVEFALNVWQVIGGKFCSFSWQKHSFCWLLVSVGLTERTASCCSINLHILWALGCLFHLYSLIVWRGDTWLSSIYNHLISVDRLLHTTGSSVFYAPPPLTLS